MKKKNYLSLITLIIAALFIPFNINPANVSAAEDTLTLDAEACPSENCVKLHWTPSNSSKEYSYQLFQQGEKETVEQSIPAKMTNIKVLNIYPTFGNNLKSWLEKPKDNYPNGYGQGSIQVSEVTLKDFNANPDAFLKDGNGKWQYDVIYFGAWDQNDAEDLSTAGAAAVRSYSEAGYGILFGHDTVRPELANFWNLRDLLKFDATRNGSIAGELTGSGDDVDVKVEKKGLLTNYPYELKFQETYSIPRSHSFTQCANGDIWIRYISNPSGIKYNDPSNFYLTTWNNCAMIQTGHSKGIPSDDEIKILTNTIFYLSQRTTINVNDAHKAQDLDAPEKPQVISLNKNFVNNTTSVTINPCKDNASTYSFYVKATPIDDESLDLVNTIKSNTVTASIETGLKGYVVVIDDTATTSIKDASNVTTDTTFTTDKAFPGDYYIHIASVDNVDNISATTTVRIPGTFVIS